MPASSQRQRATRGPVPAGASSAPRGKTAPRPLLRGAARAAELHSPRTVAYARWLDMPGRSSGDPTPFPLLRRARRRSTAIKRATWKSRSRSATSYASSTSASRAADPLPSSGSASISFQTLAHWVPSPPPLSSSLAPSSSARSLGRSGAGLLLPINPCPRPSTHVALLQASPAPPPARACRPLSTFTSPAPLRRTLQGDQRSQSVRGMSTARPRKGRPHATVRTAHSLSQGGYPKVQAKGLGENLSPHRTPLRPQVGGHLCGHGRPIARAQHPSSRVLPGARRRDRTGTQYAAKLPREPRAER
eukprot:scaffold3837_cov110-Isochrysis_galbana.AAC.4